LIFEVADDAPARYVAELVFCYSEGVGTPRRAANTE
jgi:hypothetical protein